MRNLNHRLYGLMLFISVFCLGAQAQNSGNVDTEEVLLQKADSLWYSDEFDKAILSYEKFLDNNPDKYEKVRIKLVKAYAYLGMFETAEKRASELYGVDSELRGEYCRLGLIYTMQNRNEDAVEVVNEMLRISDLDRIYPGSPTCAMFFQAKAGRYKDAAEYIYKIIDAAPGEAKLQFMLYASFLERKLGNKQKAQAILDQVSASVDQLKESGAIETILNENGGQRTYVHLAELKLMEGDDETAIDYLQKAYEKGDRYYYWIKNVSPFFEKIKDDPEFISIMEKMKRDIDRMRDNVEAKLLAR